MHSLLLQNGFAASTANLQNAKYIKQVDKIISYQYLSFSWSFEFRGDKNLCLDSVFPLLRSTTLFQEVKSIVK